MTSHTRQTQREADSIPLVRDLLPYLWACTAVACVLSFAGGVVTAVLLRIT